ncbi:MAG: hypothetical protein ABI446_04360, partial [Gemmatimonadaceae bacterium]
MSRYTNTLCGFLAALAATVASPVARAQANSPVCKTLTDAQTKTITTPHHAYSTQGPAKGPPALTGEIIQTSATSFVLVKGKWTQLKITQQDNLKDFQEKLHNLKSYSCRQLPDESKDGAVQTVYMAHSESDMANTDAKFWIAKGSGLISHEEITLDSGDGDA